MSFVQDLLAVIAPTAFAEEPAAEEVEVVEAVEAVAEPEEEEEEEEDEDEDEDEEEEAQDQFDILKKECESLPSVKPYLHHYEECIERVTKEQEEPDYEEKLYKEDCVEEFFHLQHALLECAAPKLFTKLK
ncbi:ubiquinol--cytochrome-c reductase subunit 6 [Martiniozyma asiatica (nom. inval.)]|nr:ubiquinol--cytochrome-c reductase subunit 6 [Martiniozyma asiatica]